MSVTAENNYFKKYLNLPYHLGVFLGVNAVPDSILVMDGLNCIMPKVEYVAGNHDMTSTLLSSSNMHRVICTMHGPLPQKGNHDKDLIRYLKGVADSKTFSLVFLTGLPFLKLTGVDYEGIAASVKGRAGVIDIPPLSLSGDWLDGYEDTLCSAVRALPAASGKKKKNGVAVVGYMWDRGEGDHESNIKEIKKLLGRCGLDVLCVLPSGRGFAGMKRALEAEYIISFPYGRKAAEALAEKSGAKIIETGLPIGFSGTSGWVSSVCRGAGVLPPPGLFAEEKKAALSVARNVGRFSGKKVMFAGDPYLFAAMTCFVGELGMDMKCAVLFSNPKETGCGKLAEDMFFSPDRNEVFAYLKESHNFDLVIGNSFARSEGLSLKDPFVELGFPSYSYHCLTPSPFMGFDGAKLLCARIFNALLSIP